MRSYNAAACQLVGAAAAALLFYFNQPQQVSATTETPAATGVRTLTDAPAAAPQPQAAKAAPAALAPVIAPATPQVTPSATPSATVEKPAETKSEATATEAAAAAPEKPKPLPPTLFARINLTTQTMVVQAGGKTIHTWKVSTGAPGYSTPPGSFKPTWMAQMWRSRQYDDAPMPYSVFFNGGIAVHGTMNPGSLGSARSHGCVRLATSNAATFFKLVNRHGMAQTRIIVHGRQPYGNSQLVAARASNRQVTTANAWVYTNGNSATPRSARPSTGLYNSYVAPPKAQPRRISAVRTQTTYWSR